MLGLLSAFVQELRQVGVPVSMVESIDAMEAVRHIELGDRVALKETLRATLVKNARHEPAFETAFEVFFASRRPDLADPEGPDDRGEPGSPADRARRGSGGAMDLDQLIDALYEAMRNQDFSALRSAARQAVDDLAGIEPGRPVGGTYYLYRTLRQLDVDDLTSRLIDAMLAEEGEVDDLTRRLVEEEAALRIERMREEIKEEIRRRLVEDRGHEAVARTLRQPLVEEIDLMHATRTDLRNLEQVIEPLTRKLAARLAQRRRQAGRGRLDFRKTMRASLATGGVPIEPKFRHVRPHRPELFLLCDVSGSMATFARFTLQFTYAMGTQFSKLRAFVFVDAVDEVTDHLKPGIDFKDALLRITTEADVVWLDGHSDYGHALEQFTSKYGRELTPRSTVIIAGDARNNYRDARERHLAEIADSCQALYWLNPEPKAYWDSGDSVMSRYAKYCDEVFEVRNLRQLETFVERVATQPRRTRRQRRYSSTERETLPMFTP
ncbi:MAG TPA: VWA domain-containing protein [Acidimicrobiia bacterium]|nr:VWA domain-containing protein [Acidimicrobiia bacterium]